MCVYLDIMVMMLIKNIDAFREILDEEGLVYDEIIQPRNSFIFNIKELSTNDKVSIDKLLKFPELNLPIQCRL